MSDEVRLRDVEPDDLPVFYEQQLDGDATRMAAFPAHDRAAFDAHWATNILGNPAAVIQTILLDGQVAGHIGSWRQDGVRLVGYWIGKEHWGKGVATRALAAFLHLMTERPLHAHVATTPARSASWRSAASASSARRASTSGRCASMADRHNAAGAGARRIVSCSSALSDSLHRGDRVLSCDLNGG